MAIELDGKPLKFTAEFDSREAEQNLDSFLKKIQDVNSRGVGNTSAQKAAAKASGQYKSILDDATTAFDAFANKSKDFYSEIAKAELALQKIRNEQNQLNREFRDGITTEQDHINKTAQLNGLRDQLSEKIRSNKAELKSYADEAKKQTTPKFTAQDTLNELAGAHGAGSGSPLPTLSVNEAFAKANKQAIAELNSELDELNKKLKAGSITNEQYAKSSKSISDKLEALNENQKHFTDSVSQSGQIVAQEGQKQKSVLDSLSSEYKELLQDATSAYSGVDSQTKYLTTSLLKLETESKDIAAAQKEVTAAFKNGDITQKQYTDSTKALMVQQNAVKGRIAETKRELNSLETVERKTIGSIAEKTAKLTQLKLKYDNLSRAQRENINVGGKLRKEYQDLVKEIERLNRALNGTRGQGISSLLGSARGIAGALGITFSVQQLVAFGKELYDIAREAEGIELRFAKIGDTRGLEKLRTATRGTVSDLELMKLAVNADNFRIPMDVLAKGLEFATRRASETGQSVDYLVNSFVTGLGRKSKLILDNLGISAVELNDEISKTGDFAASVGNIIEREMAKSGTAVEGLTEKTNRLSVTWANFKKNLAEGITDFFVPGRPNADNVEKLTEAYKNSFEAIKGYSDDARKRFIDNSQKQLSEVNKNIQNLTIDSPAFKKLYEDSKKDRSLLKRETPDDYLARLQKPLIEQQQAIQATLAYARGVTSEMAIQARQAKGIFSMAEVQEKLEDANLVYKNSVGDAKRAEAKKEVDKWQKLYDDMNIKSSKKQESAAEKLRKQIQRDEDERVKLLDSWSKADADYLNKQMSRDQQEIESVKNKYAEIRKAIEKYNRDTKGKRISLVGLDTSMQNSITAVQDRQATDKRIKLYQQDYENYSKYENLKLELGEEVADGQYGKYKTALTKIGAEYAALISKMFSIGLTYNETSLFKALDSVMKDQGDKQKGAFNTLLSQYQTYTQKRVQLTEKFNKELADLEAKGETDRAKRAKQLFDESQKQLFIDEVEDSPEYKKAIENIERSSQTLLSSAFKIGKESVYKIIDGMTDASNEQKANLKKIFSEFFDQGEQAANEGMLSRIAQMTDGFGQLVQSSFQFKDNLDGGLETISNMLRTASQLSQVLAENQRNENGTLNEAGKALSSIGAIGAIAGALFSLGSAISNGFNRAREQANAEIQQQYDFQNDRQLRVTEAVTKALERQLELITEIYGADRLDKYAESLENIRSNWIDINNQLAGRYMLTNNDQFANDILRRLNNGETQKQILKSWSVTSKEYWRANNVLENLDMFQRLESLPQDITKAREKLAALQYQANLGNVDDYTQKLIDQLQAQIDLYDETLNKLREETTGNAFSSLLSEVSQLFLNEGQNAAQAWTDGFDKVMENYMMQKFSRDYLQEKMQSWYETMATFAEDGMDENERKELRKQWDAIRAEGDKRIEDMRKVLGLEDNKSSSLKSESIAQSITESTGSEIVGTFRAGYDIWKRQLNAMELQNKTQVSLLQVANDKLLVLNAININTANTVARLDTAVKHLQNIDKNLGGAYARN
ncbi:hypothetical protein [Sphingobacterium paludis]|uniref:Tape measure domain-containing protein n=1 Tax=Sphingobacterium paludis TaxID=1476465 RepID=A0A4R7D1V8_9SPHI|nr:hypothetical protein [Sphingobacterium paludis]TDS14730.1 hypothetical protein B0I21_103229 [Sphingobacterium paludis]